MTVHTHGSPPGVLIGHPGARQPEQQNQLSIGLPGIHYMDNNAGGWNGSKG